jgi:hypothetical protein
LTIQKKNVRIFTDRFRYGVVLTERIDKDKPVCVATCLGPKLSSADLVWQKLKARKLRHPRHIYTFGNFKLNAKSGTEKGNPSVYIKIKAL